MIKLFSDNEYNNNKIKKEVTSISMYDVFHMGIFSLERRNVIESHTKYSVVDKADGFRVLLYIYNILYLINLQRKK